MELLRLLVLLAIVFQCCERSLVELSVMEGDCHFVEGKSHVERVTPGADAEVLSELAVNKGDLALMSSQGFLLVNLPLECLEHLI